MEDANTVPGQGLDLRIRAGGATGVADRSEGRTDVDLLDTTTTIIVENVGGATTSAGPLGRPASTNPHLGLRTAPLLAPGRARRK